MCELCGGAKSRQSRFGNLCYTCYQKRKYAADPTNRIEQIQRRDVRFRIEERVVDGRLVKVKICPPGSAEGCRSGLRTVDYRSMAHAKQTTSSKGKYRRK